MTRPRGSSARSVCYGVLGIPRAAHYNARLMPCSERPDQRFRPCERLRLEKDFARVLKTGRKASDKLLVVYAAVNPFGWSRLGISIPKRIGNAVRRHYVRRRIREAFRRNKLSLPRGFDIACVARPDAAQPGARIEESLIRLANKLVPPPQVRATTT